MGRFFKRYGEPVLAAVVLFVVGYMVFVPSSQPERIKAPRLYTTTRKRPECALLFFGIARSPEQTVPNIKRYIINHNKACDVFVHTYSSTHITSPRNGEQESPLHPEMLFALTENENVLVDSPDIVGNTSIYHKYFPPKVAGWDFPSSMDNMIHQWTSIERVWDLMERAGAYKRIGLFRSDTLYSAPINISTTEPAVVPIANTFEIPSLNDRFFYGDKPYAQRWATQRFVNVEKYMQSETAQHWGLRSENFLHWLMRPTPVAQNLKMCSKRIRATGVMNQKDEHECAATMFDTNHVFITYNFGNFRNELKRAKQQFTQLVAALHKNQIRCFAFSDVIGAVFPGCHAIYVPLGTAETPRSAAKHVKFRFHPLVKRFRYVWHSDMSPHSLKAMHKLIEQWNMRHVVERHYGTSLFIRHHPRRNTMFEEIHTVFQKKDIQNHDPLQKWAGHVMEYSSPRFPLLWTNVWVMDTHDKDLVALWESVPSVLTKWAIARDQLVIGYVFEHVDYKRKIMFVPLFCKDPACHNCCLKPGESACRPAIESKYDLH